MSPLLSLILCVTLSSSAAAQESAPAQESAAAQSSEQAAQNWRSWVDALAPPYIRRDGRGPDRGRHHLHHEGLVVAQQQQRGRTLGRGWQLLEAWHEVSK